MTRDDVKQINRTLAGRLAIAGTITAVLLGGVAFLLERDRVGNAVVDHALQGARNFSREIRHLLDVPGLPDRAAMQREIDELERTPAQYRLGHFVHIRVYTVSEVVAELGEAEYEHRAAVKEFIADSPPRLPAHGGRSYEVERFGGAPHVLVAVPLENSAGETVAYADGVFALSKEAIADLRRAALTTMFAVVLVVLVTTVILYPLIAMLMRRVTRLSVQLLDANLEMLGVLGSAIAKRDSDTDAHNFRVTILSIRIGEAVGLETAAMRSLMKGAFLHDVGKIAISDSILLKPGRLTEEEFEVMKTHVRHGLDIVERSAWLEDAADVVGHHHEKIDGSGYLQGKEGVGIPLNARIFAIADVFDALSSKRPYKGPLAFEEVMNILEEGRGTHFDSTLLDAFRPIAQPLHRELTPLDEAGLSANLDVLVDKYFPRERVSQAETK